METIRSRILQREEKVGREKFTNMTVSKSMRGWINGQIGKFSKKGDIETEFIFKEVLRAYNHFHPERKVAVEVKGWKGKSTFEIIREIDRLIIIKYIRRDKDSVPQEVRVELNREELQVLISLIKILSKKGKKISTKQIARAYCLALDIRKTDKGRDLFVGDFWTQFFGWRSMHYKLTLALSALDRMGLIEYKGGKTTLIEKNISIQMVLD